MRLSKRWLVRALIFAVVGFGAYHFMRASASERVRKVVITMPDDKNMGLDPEDREKVRGYIQSAHDEAFDAALYLKGMLVPQFDSDLYIDVLFDRLTEQARGDDRPDLAEKLLDAKKRLSFGVSQL